MSESQTVIMSTSDACANDSLGKSGDEGGLVRPSSDATEHRPQHQQPQPPQQQQQQQSSLQKALDIKPDIRISGAHESALAQPASVISYGQAGLGGQHPHQPTHHLHHQPPYFSPYGGMDAFASPHQAFPHPFSITSLIDSSKSAGVGVGADYASQYYGHAPPNVTPSHHQAHHPHHHQHAAAAAGGYGALSPMMSQLGSSMAAGSGAVGDLGGGYYHTLYSSSNPGSAANL